MSYRSFINFNYAQETKSLISIEVGVDRLPNNRGRLILHLNRTDRRPYSCRKSSLCDNARETAQVDGRLYRTAAMICSQLDHMIRNQMYRIIQRGTWATGKGTANYKSLCPGERDNTFWSQQLTVLKNTNGRSGIISKEKAARHLTCGFLYWNLRGFDGGRDVPSSSKSDGARLGSCFRFSMDPQMPNKSGMMRPTYCGCCHNERKI